MSYLLALDVETTSADPDTAKVVQIGAVRITPNACPDGEPVNVLVNPDCEIPEEASAVHGIRYADVWQAPRFADVWRDDIEPLVAGAAAIVTFNGRNFDLPALLREIGDMPSALAGKPHIDVRVFVEWHHRAARPRTLGATADAYGAPLGDAAHDAAADCVATGRILLGMMCRPWARQDPLWMARESDRLAKLIDREIESVGPFMYGHRRTGELMFGAGIVNGRAVVCPGDMTFSERAAVRRIIEADETPEDMRADLKSYATPREDWARYGRHFATRDDGQLCVAIGQRWCGEPVAHVSPAYLRGMLLRADDGDMTDGARSTAEQYASTTEDYERFGSWLYNDSKRRLRLGCGKHAGELLYKVPGKYLVNMLELFKQWEDPPPEEVARCFGAELGRRSRRNRRA